VRDGALEIGAATTLIDAEAATVPDLL